MYHKPQTKGGFTLAELLIAVAILGLISVMAVNVYFNLFGAIRNLKASNLIYEEARFVMERIVREIRNGTIDYEEYYNQNLFKDRLPGSYEYALNESYGQDYCQYNLLFYSEGADGDIGTYDDESTGIRDDAYLPAIGRDDGEGGYEPDPVQSDLFLININGDRRTYLKRIEKPDENDTVIGKIAILRMTGYDFGVDHINAFDTDLNPGTSTNDCVADSGEGDGKIDTWLCDDEFTCSNNVIDDAFVPSCGGGGDDLVAGHIITYDPGTPADNSFIDITPSSLDITDLKFIISPMDDPRKAYNTNDVQVQPHITIKMTVKANPLLATEFRSGNLPTIVLESTVSARAYNKTVTECNLKMCENGTFKDCPLTAGVCGNPAGDPANQQCADYRWPGCDVNTYELHADMVFGGNNGCNDMGGVGNDCLYQDGTEFASCSDDACKDVYCSDNNDNDCNGFEDEDDSNCINYFCNNTNWDNPQETCMNVGGICDEIRPFESDGETSCFDGYDNDCDGDIDVDDPDCITYLCNNGIFEDPEETCIDVGGICDGIRPVQAPTETSCFDGYDNDCDTLADEFDPDCQSAICTNTFKNCDLAPSTYPVTDYLANYSSSFCYDDNDEICADMGGICDGFVDTYDHTYYATEVGRCSDGIDNDCDTLIDSADTEDCGT